MTDTAGLQIKVETRGVKQSAEELKKMAKAGQGAEAATDRLAKSFKRLALQATAGVTIGAVFAKIVSATREQEAAITQLRQGIESTAGAAGKSLDQLTRKAAELQRVTTFADEEIIRAQSVLVTFTNVAGEAFDRATEAALDMSARLGTDLNSSIQLIGKALNDPIQGMNALTRSNVQLSEAQKETIKNLVETGRVAEAQKIILDELERKFGGSAKAARETFGGALKGLRDAFGDLFEATKGLDDSKEAINKLTEALSNSEVVRAMDTLTSSVIRLGAGFLEATAAVVNFFASIPVRPVTELRTEILALELQLASFEKNRPRRGARGESRSVLADRLDELKAELKTALLTSRDLAEIDEGIRLIEDRQAALEASIRQRRAAGEKETRGAGRSKQLTDLGRELKELERLEGALAAATAHRAKVQDESSKSAGVVAGAIAETGEATKEVSKSILDIIAKLEEQAATLGMTERQLLEYKLKLDTLPPALRAAATAALDTIDSFNQLKEAAQLDAEMMAMFEQMGRDRNRGMEAEAKQFFQSTRTEAEQLKAQIARVKELAAQGFFAKSGIDDQEILARLQAQLDSLGDSDVTGRVADAFRNQLGGAIEELFARGELSAKSFFEAVLRDIARMAVQLMLIQPIMESLFGAAAGGGGSGSGLLGGLFKKSATGGSYKVGGSGGSDSKLVGMRLTPGELVEVTPAHKAGKADGGTVVNVIDQRGGDAPPVEISRQQQGGREIITALIRTEIANTFANGQIDKMFRASSMPVARRGNR